MAADATGERPALVDGGVYRHEERGRIHLSLWPDPRKPPIAALFYAMDDDEVPYVVLSWTSPLYRRNGLALRLYETMIRRYGRLRSDSTQSAAVGDLWRAIALLPGLRVSYGARDSEERHEASVAADSLLSA